MARRPAEAQDADFFAVDSEDGRLAFLGFYGVVGTFLTFVLLDGWLIPVVLAAGVVVGGLMPGGCTATTTSGWRTRHSWRPRCIRRPRQRRTYH